MVCPSTFIECVKRTRGRMLMIYLFVFSTCDEGEIDCELGDCEGTLYKTN